MKNIAFVTTDIKTIDWFLLPIIEQFLKKNLKVYVFCNDYYHNEQKLKNLFFIKIPIERKISIISDIKVLISLIYLFKKYRISFVHSIMPKSGLLSQFAAFLNRIPIRIHTFTGQVWSNKKGFKKFILKFFDKVISLFATNILCDGLSQRNFLIQNNIVKSDKIDCIHLGSIIGVNTKRFSYNYNTRIQMRKFLNINIDSFVFVYVGRLNIEKGISDLLNAFSRINNGNIKSYLLIIGDNEDFENKYFCKYKHIKNNIIRLNYKKNIEKYLMSADVICLPSQREGFSNVIIEAGSMGIPAVVSDIYGLNETVEDNYTGLKHRVLDRNDIYEKMKKIFIDKTLYNNLSKNVLIRTKKYFDQKIIIHLLSNYYFNIGLTEIGYNCSKYLFNNNNNNNNNILVIGGGGYFGTNLCEYLNKLSNNVFTIVKKRNYKLDIDIKQIIISDINNLDDFNFLKNINTVVYLPKGDIKTVQLIFQQCIDNKINKFIYLSSISLYENYINISDKINLDTKLLPENKYAQEKLKIENLLIKMNKKNLDLIIFRSSPIYGNGCRGDIKILIFFLKYNLPVIAPVKKNKRSLINIYDFCELITKATDVNIKLNKNIFLVSENIDISSLDLINALKKFYKSKSVIIKVPYFIEKLLFKLKIFPKFFESLYYTKRLDITETIKIFGWKPKYNFKNNLSKLNIDD